MIKRNEYQGDLALGKRIKTTTVATLDSITELSQTVADTITTARAGVELLHGALQIPIMEQRIEIATIAKKGLDDLVALGMTQQEACSYLQVPFVPKTSKLANVVTA